MYFSVILCLCLLVGINTNQDKPIPGTIKSVDVLHCVRYQTTSDWVKTSSTIDKKRGYEIVNFQRSPIQTDSAKKLIATQACKVESIPQTNIQSYSLNALKVFQTKKDFKLNKIITHTDGLLQLTYAIGYWASYTDEANVAHKLIIIHAIHHNGKGLQFFIDCPHNAFSELEGEITEQIRSLTFI